jgi:putative addiction module component (TIGR02574 family)
VCRSGQQFLHREGLDEVVVRPRVEPLHAVRDGVPGGEQQDGNEGAGAPPALHGHEPVAAGEPPVENDEIVPVFREVQVGLGATPRLVDGVPQGAESTCEGQPKFTCVVDEEDPHDAGAKSQLEEWFPGREVYIIETLESWYAGGGVHCHTNDQPALVPWTRNGSGSAHASTLQLPPRGWGSKRLLVFEAACTSRRQVRRRVGDPRAFTRGDVSGASACAASSHTLATGTLSTWWRRRMAARSSGLNERRGLRGMDSPGCRSSHGGDGSPVTTGSAHDRLRLAAELIDSVEGPEDPDWTAAWSAEVERRSADADARAARGEPRGTPWEDVRARVLARLGRA